LNSSLRKPVGIENNKQKSSDQAGLLVSLIFKSGRYL
jgi:hypothetical protein